MNGRLLYLSLFAGALGCGGPPQWNGQAPSPHLGEAFHGWRAETLGITLDEARNRDASRPDGEGEVPYA